MRDTNLVFHDGTNFTATVTPVSTTRSGGSAVLDMGKSGVKGFWVQAILAVAIVGASGTIDVKIQYSDSATFASGIEDGPSFPQLNNTSTVVPYRRSLLCQTKRRYVRALLTKGGTLTTETLYVHVVSGPARDDNA
jgi:hypothetical protein